MRALAAVLALLASLGCRGEEAPAAAAQPNLLLVTLDTTRRDRLGAYGSERGLTPRLDALAEGGVLFLDARTQAPITLPVHTTLLTGLDLLEHGVRENGTFALEASARTLAEVLSDAGYASAAFVSSYVLDRRFGLDQGFGHYDDDFSAVGQRPRSWQGQRVEHWERPAEATTSLALAWLDAWRLEDGPFFVWVHYYDPHQPWEPPGPPGARAEAAYDGEIRSVDRAVGRLLDALEMRGLTGATLVAVASDHGEALGEHGRQGHGFDLYEPAMRAVLILSRPGLLPTGARMEARVRLADVPATLLELAGVAGVPLPGRSLAPLWQEGGRSVPAGAEPLYLETLLPRLRASGPEVVGVLQGRWKLVVRRPPERAELYDLASDPEERMDRAAQEPERVEALLGELRVLEGRRAAQPPSRALALDPETARRLQALGYLQPDAR